MSKCVRGDLWYVWTWTFTSFKRYQLCCEAAGGCHISTRYDSLKLGIYLQINKMYYSQSMDSGIFLLFSAACRRLMGNLHEYVCVCVWRKQKSRTNMCQCRMQKDTKFHGWLTKCETDSVIILTVCMSKRYILLCIYILEGSERMWTTVYLQCIYLFSEKGKRQLNAVDFFKKS